MSSNSRIDPLYLANDRSINNFNVQFSSLEMEKGLRLITFSPLYDRFLTRQTIIRTPTMMTLRMVSATEAMKRPSDHLSQPVFVMLGSMLGLELVSSQYWRMLMDRARKRMLVKIYMQIKRSTKVREVASGKFQRTMGCTAAQAIINAATLMILFMIQVVWQKTQTLMNPSSQMGMKMVIMSTTGKRKSGILKMAYLKGLNQSWVGWSSKNTLSFPDYSSKLRISRSSWVYASMQLSATSYFPKLLVATLTIMGAIFLIFSSRGRFGLRMGSSSLKLLKFIFLMMGSYGTLCYLNYLSQYFIMPTLRASMQVAWFFLFDLLLSPQYSNAAVSMWSNATVRSRLMKLYGAQNQSVAELLMISMVNSFLMMWNILHPSTWTPFLLYSIRRLNAWIWNSLERVVGSFTVTSLLKVTGMKLDFLQIFFFLFFQRTASSSGFQYSLQRRNCSR